LDQCDAFGHSHGGHVDVIGDAVVHATFLPGHDSTAVMLTVKNTTRQSDQRRDQLGRDVLFLVSVWCLSSCAHQSWTSAVTHWGEKYVTPRLKEKTFRVNEGNHPRLEARVRQSIAAWLKHPEIVRRGYTFDGEVVVKPVRAKYKDALGVPFWSTQAEGLKGDRSGGMTLYTGKNRPVLIVIATYPSGAWDERTLVHECAHVVLLWNGVEGHPPEWKEHIPLWD
jgi:hypothetical protein